MSISSWTIFLSFLSVSTALLFENKICCESINECFERAWSPTKPRPKCPEGPAEPKYHLWTRSHESQPDIFTLDHIPLDKFRNSQKIYVIVHGWLNSANLKWVLQMKDELLKKEDSNVIVVDWENLAFQLMYPQPVSDIKSLGAHVAKVLEKIKASRKEHLYTWCIGFSLGAHLCGQVGRRSHLNRITALDPAGPLFEDLSHEGVSKNDTDFLDVVHTDHMAGYNAPLGHVDFYPNEGHSQPMCLFRNAKCSHDMACDFFIASINNGCFEAQLCSDYNEWENCVYSGQRMGYHASPDKEGIFYLKTSNFHPYCYPGDERNVFHVYFTDPIKNFYENMKNHFE